MKASKYAIGGEQPRDFEMPLEFVSDPEVIIVKTYVQLPYIHPRIYHLIPDDCIESMIVNDIEVQDSILPICDYSFGRGIDLNQYVHAGTNTFLLRMRNHGGPAGLKITVSHTDPLFIALAFVFILVVGLYGVAFMRFFFIPVSILNRMEWGLLWSFVTGRLLLFFFEKGNRIGWDVESHLQMLDAWPWESTFWSVRSAFYAYHPPVLFFLNKLAFTLLDHKIMSVQFISLILSLAAFFFLRSFVKRMGYMDKIEGVSFLYITSLLPVQTNMVRAVNMDIAIYAVACAALYFSSYYIVSAEGDTKRNKILNTIWLSIALIIGLYSKSSGLLILAIPGLVGVYLLFQKSGVDIKRWKVHFPAMSYLFIAIATAILVAFPYYYGRNYVQEGKFFVSNMDFEQFDKYRADHFRETNRDKDVQAFFRDLFIGMGPPGVHQRDFKRARFANTWKDIWAGSNTTMNSGILSLLLSNIYSIVGTILLVVGLAYFPFMYWKKRAKWHDVGVIIFVFCVLQLLASVAYVYKYPMVSGMPTKLLYIAPIILGIGYFMAVAVALVSRILKDTPAFQLLYHRSLFVMAILVIIFNNCLPIY